MYKEDFNKFVKALNNTVNHVKDELLPDVDFDQFDREREEKAARDKVARENENPQDEKSQEDEKVESGIDTELKWE